MGLYPLVWLGILILISIIYWSANIHTKPSRKFVISELKKQVISFSIIAVVSLILMALLWPFILYNPIKNFPDALSYMAKFPFIRDVLYNGQYIPTDKLPWEYTFRWLLITTPIISIVLFLIGIVTLWYKTSLNFFKEAKIGVVFLAFATPLLVILVERSNLYNGIRQFMFVVPAMFLVGSYGFLKLFNYLKRRRLKIGLFFLLAVFMFGYVYTIKEISSYYPFEYIYYNGLVKGIKGAERKYELDYNGLCFKSSAEWINENYKKYTARKNPSFDAVLPFQTGYYLDRNFKNDYFSPDFNVYNLYNISPNRFPEYTVVHTIKADGAPICIVSIDPKVINHTKKYLSSL